jgi:hypothetical protein
MDSIFSMYILSNGSSRYYPYNSLSKFSVKLPISFTLPTSFNEKWGIALNTIGVSSKFTSDYSKDIKMPIMIELLSYTDQYDCPNILGVDLYKNPCYKEKSSYNQTIKNISRFCHSDDSDDRDCELDFNIVKQLDDWVASTIRFGGIIENFVDGLKTNSFKPFSKQVVYNFYYNSLKNKTSLDKFLKNLTEHELIININTPNNIILSNKPDQNIERLIFIRKDFFDKSSVEQIINRLPETNTIDTDKSILFPNVKSARLINKSIITMNNISYVILVINKEHINLNIDFTNFKENFLSIPHLIKIKCDNIRSQIFNNTHSKDIETFKPSFHEFDNHYFHEFENPTYVKLMNTSLKDLTFELTDEYDNLLNLEDGISTVLQVSFKRMPATKKSFSIRLTPLITVEENSVCKFSSILPNILNLNEDWRVGLKEITFPTNIKTFSSNSNEIIVRELNQKMQYIPRNLREHKFNLENAIYTEESLLNTIKSKLESLDWLTFSIENNSLQVVSSKNCEITIYNDLAMLLGAPVFSNHSKTMGYSFECRSYEIVKIGTNIDMNIHRPAFLMVYCDIVKPTLISSDYANILRIVPITYGKNPNEYQSVEFKNIEYKEISNNFINIIQTEVRSHSGSLIQFDSNFLSLHLYFTNDPFNE